MTPVARTLTALTACALLLSGCSRGDAQTPMGWVETQDEQSDADFALPPPVTGPETTERRGRTTTISSRAWTSRVGDVAFSVQVLSTPQRPDALEREVPADRMPFLAVEQVMSEGDYEAQVLSNDRVDEADLPTYDAHLELSSANEEAIWWMRTRALDDVVLVTQVVAFVEGDRAEVEDQARVGFDRLNETVDLP